MERRLRLNNINTCLLCGANGGEVVLDRDHFFPRCLASKPDRISPLVNPFRKVVYYSQNIFRICRPEHLSIDSKKTRAFSPDGFKTLDPVALIGYLMESYPITTRGRLRYVQINSMVNSTFRFAEAAYCLNGEMPKDLVRRYQEAADLAWNFIRKLEAMKNRG